MLQTIEVAIDANPAKGIESLFGILKAKEGISLEAMDAAIRRRVEARLHRA